MRFTSRYSRVVLGRSSPGQGTVASAVLRRAGSSSLLPPEEVDHELFGRSYKKFVVSRGPAIRYGGVEKVPVDKLIATQDFLDDAVVRKYEKKPGDLPIVIRQNGKLYVGDGHHRIEALIHQGREEIEALVVDVDERGHPTRID